MKTLKLLMLTLFSKIMGRLWRLYFMIIEMKMESKKNEAVEVGICGNYTTGNIGDHAIGEAFKQYFLKKNIKFRLYHMYIGETKARYTVLGGGGVIHDHIKDALKKRLSFLNGKNLLIGIGFQEIQDTAMRNQFASIIDNSIAITARDPESVEKIQQLSSKEIILVSCPAFTLEVPKVDVKNITGISFRPWFGLGAYGDVEVLHKHFGYDKNLDVKKAKEAYLQNMKFICDSVENPVFIPFNPGEDFFARKYLDIPVLNYIPSVSVTLERIARCKQIVATRYHSNVFGILCNKPMISIAYAPKVEQLALMAGVNYYKPNEKIKSLEFAKPLYRDKIIQMSEKNFEIIAEGIK